jgi:hypothetical protein
MRTDSDVYIDKKSFWFKIAITLVAFQVQKNYELQVSELNIVNDRVIEETCLQEQEKLFLDNPWLLLVNCMEYFMVSGVQKCE